MAGKPSDTAGHHEIRDPVRGDAKPVARVAEFIEVDASPEQLC
jgi:hypothetical protein